MLTRKWLLQKKIKCLSISCSHLRRRGKVTANLVVLFSKPSTAEVMHLNITKATLITDNALAPLSTEKMIKGLFRKYIYMYMASQKIVIIALFWNVKNSYLLWLE